MSDHPLWILLDFVSETEQTEATMADNYVNMPVNQSAFNWECTNIIEEWKHYHRQVELLLVVGPYSSMTDKMKVVTLQNWMTDRGQKINKDELVFPDEEDKKKDHNKLVDILDVFEAHFTPLQFMIHSWYNLGVLHSHHCKDQSDFISKFHNLAKDWGFTNQDEVIKFLFLIHNSHRYVQDQLLKEITNKSTINDFLQSPRWLKAIIQSEKLAQKMHQSQKSWYMTLKTAIHPQTFVAPTRVETC